MAVEHKVHVFVNRRKVDLEDREITGEELLRAAGFEACHPGAPTANRCMGRAGRRCLETFSALDLSRSEPGDLGSCGPRVSFTLTLSPSIRPA